jgi:hypothetical protein
LLKRFRTYWFILLIVVCDTLGVHAQQDKRVEKVVRPAEGWVVLDTHTVYWPSLEIYDAEGNPLRAEIDTLNNSIRLNTLPGDSIKLIYRTFGFNLHTERLRKDTTIIYNPVKGIENPFLYDAESQSQDFFGGSDLKKSGSISRGINFGNSQDLSVNSTLNMQLSGDISPNLKLMASLSDDNIPIQADGNTNKLQEFDRLFIQLYNDEFKLIAGDFWMKKPHGYFMTYNKRAQGLMGEYRSFLNEEKTKSWKVYGGGAFSKGKFNRQLIQGVEGNQGPYRLRGAENETFIIVLAGTERVFINGIELERGQEYDYVMNYNTSEITFTPRRPIDKDSRIIVEFQYADQNYARSLFAGGLEYQSKKARFWLNAYSEQDAKNQSIQQDLSPEQRFFLGTIGDSLEKALIFSIDSVGYRDNQIMYRLVDTLGYDSVLVFSVNPAEAVYSAAFSFVGQGNGDYVFDQFTALGRVYRWVQPVAGVRQGNYAPVRIVITPKKRQMVTAGAEVDLGRQFRLFSEVSYSNNDINTFSDLDKDDNQSVAARVNLLSTTKLGKDSLSPWLFKSNTGLEFTGQYFTQIERFRSAEFERDWNVLNEQIDGFQFMGMTDLRVEHKRNGFFGVTGETFLWGNDFTGYKGGFNGQWAKKGFAAKWTSSVLGSDGVRESFFTRHMVDVSQTIWKIKVGFWDEYELNKTTPRVGEHSLSTSSYQFLDWKVYLTQADSTKNKFQVYYRQRNDQLSDSFALRQAARAHNVGGSFDWLSNSSSQLRTLVNYRVLQITDTNLIQLQPENTLLGRIEYNLNVWKGALRSTTFYEVGSGLELKREFIYIEVVAGKGVYTWIDYNGDGIKDLNEFEIAAFPDQANYVRVFTPSDEYVKTYTNEFSQSIFLQPERLWARKKGVLKLLSRFSDQAQFRIARKSDEETVAGAFNPFRNLENDPSLISASSSVRNTFFFNRTSQVVGADYTYSALTNRILLANGFDQRTNNFHQLNFRWNIARKYTVKMTGETGVRASEADYTSGRDFRIYYDKLKPELVYQPGTAFRISLLYRYERKVNKLGTLGETARINDTGIEVRYNQLQKGSLTGTINMVNINFLGEANSALGFEMLEALKPGRNFTWTVNYQRNLGKNLQLSLRYNGRKSEDNRTIHTGGIEMRAFF